MILDFVALQIMAASTSHSSATQSITMGFKIANVKMREEIICSTVSKFKKLRTLMITYCMLCDTVHQANDFNCDQLMAVLFSLFVHVTIRSYFFFIHVRSGDIVSLTRDAVGVLILIRYTILADMIFSMICKLINKDMDPKFRNQLECFLLQLPYHNARFSARDFFRIHNQTLTSMAGAVTTYLVILIQFQTENQPT
ncbi:gustatory receptor 68a-like [Homalodisca vitripennis]|uniref:gustatory receptor 68a-like n=1 Tax=Homalodisca vitripennis TaxID=197043 RepID=UPI001EEA5B13|nr:gustatory receptor 68a-like [Homalodisca vitripennis]